MALVRNICQNLNKLYGIFEPIMSVGAKDILCGGTIPLEIVYVSCQESYSFGILRFFKSTLLLTLACLISFYFILFCSTCIYHGWSNTSKSQIPLCESFV